MKEKDKNITGKKSPVKIILIILTVIVSLILVLFATAYFYTKSQISPLASNTSNPTEDVQKTRIEIYYCYLLLPAFLNRCRHDLLYY